LYFIFHYSAFNVLTLVRGLKKILLPQAGQTNLFSRFASVIFFPHLKHLYVTILI